MNSRQKIVQQRFLNNEKAVIDDLESTYKKALTDVQKKVKKLSLEVDKLQGEIEVFDGTDEEREVLQSKLQSKIYQKRYQEALHGQIDTVLDTMNEKQFNTVSDYLKTCYDDGYIGTVYDLQGQGIPIATPINQENVVRAVQTDSKISQGLYTRMGEDVGALKQTIANEVSRGLVTGVSYDQIAQQIRYKMVGTEYGKGGALSRAKTIARTEGHRIQNVAAMDACNDAKEAGADVVKQWDATLDGKTRESHSQVDGEIRELDKPFSNGLQYPGDSSGGAAEVVNCRCALLRRARWAVKGGFTKMNNFTKEIETFESPAQYDEFKKAFFSKENKQFMNYHTALESKYGTRDFEKLLGSMTDEEYKHWQKLYNNSPIYNKAAKSTAEAVKKPAFTPAKTIDEAQLYADKFVSSYKSKYSGTVDYSGIQVGYANEMNRAFTEVFDAYETEHQIRNIKPFNMREARFKGTDAEAAYQWGTSDMFFNKGYYKTEKAFKAHLQQYNDLMEQVLPNIDIVIEQYRGVQGSIGKAKLRYMEALKRTGRTNVFPPDAYGSTIHEMGHYLDDELFRKSFKENGFDLSASFDKYSGGISAYATSSTQEYVAESFAAYWKGETDVIDPELLRIFERAKKK